MPNIWLQARLKLDLGKDTEIEGKWLFWGDRMDEWEWRKWGESRSDFAFSLVLSWGSSPSLSLLTGKDFLSSQFKDWVVIVLSYAYFTSCVPFPKGIGKIVGHAGKGGSEHTWALPGELGQVSSNSSHSIESYRNQTTVCNVLILKSELTVFSISF